MNEEGIKLLKHYESLHDGDLHRINLQPKLCPAGIWTAGYGHALVHPDTGKFLREEDKELAYQLAGNLTEEEAEQWLLQDLRRFEAIVRSHFSGLDQAQFSALVSLCYNIGAGNFASSSVVRFVKQNKTTEAAEAILLWNKARVKGKMTTLRGLTARRKSERHLFINGVFKPFN